MKKLSAAKHLLLPGVLVIATAAFGQTRLVLNGAQLVIANNASLVIENPAADAITRSGGGIISEGERNTIKWVIGQTTGAYTIPWSDGTTYFPLTFTKSAGSGAGNFLFSTFSTPPQNSLNLPTGVTNMNRSGSDKSLFFIDRFWQLNAQGYTAKPSLTGLQFGYKDAEHDLPNTIVEASMGALRWNDDTNTWDGFAKTGVASTSGNTVTVASIASADLYKWWSLVSEASILPVRFLSFTALRQGTTGRLTWKTADEVNVSHYEVERSVNGGLFTSLGSAPAVGGAGPHTYSYIDASLAKGRNTYRIKEMDRNGAFHYSPIRFIEKNEKMTLEVYPNPVTGNRFTINTAGIPAGLYTVQLYGMDGTLAASFTKAFTGNVVVIEVPKPLAKGSYLLKLINGANTFSTPVIIN